MAQGETPSARLSYSAWRSSSRVHRLAGSRPYCGELDHKVPTGDARTTTRRSTRPPTQIPRRRRLLPGHQAFPAMLRGHPGPRFVLAMPNPERWLLTHWTRARRHYAAHIGSAVAVSGRLQFGRRHVRRDVVLPLHGPRRDLCRTLAEVTEGSPAPTALGDAAVSSLVPAVPTAL